MEMMAKMKKNHEVFLKVSSVVAMMFFMVVLALYQGLVNENYQPLRAREFFSKNFWQQVSAKSWSSDPEFASCTSSQNSSSIYMDTYIASVACTDGCVITIDGTDSIGNKYNNVQILAITESNDKFDTNIHDLQILAADLERGRILYQVDENKKIYFIRIDPKEMREKGKTEAYLIQEIYLAPDHSAPMSFIALKRSTKGEDFLLMFNSARKELYLYGLDTLWLKKISVEETTHFTAAQYNDMTACLKARDLQSEDETLIDLINKKR